MNKKHCHSNVKQARKKVVRLSTMGNLFSKEERDEGTPQTVRTTGNETRVNALCPSPVSSESGSDDFFKYLDKDISRGTLLNEGIESDVLESEKIMLNAFLAEVRNAKPTPLKNWSALQHFIYYIYRHSLSERPCNSNEIFPNVVVRKIRELFDSLLKEDFTQLCIRLVTLVREYAIVARGHFTNLQHPKLAAYVISLMSYYSAFCSAASKLAPLLPEFDFLIMERFNVNWLCLNKSIFYYYIYMSPAVQDKLPLFEKLKEDSKSGYKNLFESYTCFSEDMSLICARWNTLKTRISQLSHKRALTNPAKYLLNDWRVFEEQKKILKTNYWIVRNTHAIQIQDRSELDAHIISLVGDIAYIADFLIDNQGQCLCEDCLAAEFRSSTMNSMPSAFQPHSSIICRVIMCYICQDPIALDGLATHIVTEHNDMISQKQLTKHTRKINELGKSFPPGVIFGNTVEVKEALFKLVGGQLSKNEEKNDENMTSIEAKQDELMQSKKKSFAEHVYNSLETMESKQQSSNPKHHIRSCVSQVFQTPVDSVLKLNKEPLFKIASGASTIHNGKDFMFKGTSNTKEKIESYKMNFDEFLNLKTKLADTRNNKTAINDVTIWQTTEATNTKSGELLIKDAGSLSNSKDISKNDDYHPKGKKSNCSKLAAANISINSSLTENTSFRKPQQKDVSNSDQNLLDLLKNANNPRGGSTADNKSNDSTNCLGHACGHKCKQEEDKTLEVKKHSCLDICEHHKESRKCDCAYCEVFGATLPSHTYKTNETRNRLRTRLNQRKEKVNEGATNKGITKTSLNAKLNCTIKITGTPKISINGKSVQVNANSNSKLNVKSSNDNELQVPLRVPEVVHPVSPSSNAYVETKKALGLSNSLTLHTQKALVNQSFPIEKSESNLPARSSFSLSSSSLNSDNVDSRDINELLNYIEGNKNIDRIALAQKKAAKKARQRIRKAQERLQIETEKRLKQERLKEEKQKEERLKAEALAKQLAEQEMKIKKQQEEMRLQQKQDLKKNKKKSKTLGGNVPTKTTEKKIDSNLIEETIPAMVTIKRVSEGNDSPATVTITLKGSTPESDKLLFTLVNGHNDKDQNTTATVSNDKIKKSKTDSTIKIQSQVSTKKGENGNQKKKNKKSTNEISSKEIKVTIAVDKNNVAKKLNLSKISSKLNDTQKEPDLKNSKGTSKNNKETVKTSQLKSVINNLKEDVHLPMLRLPPGITITKIEGPLANRNCRVTSDNSIATNDSNTKIPVSKSGVIVVDTEKLIQQSITASNNKKNKKKNKKKKDCKVVDTGFEKSSTEKKLSNNSGSSMVTLKNPIFHNLDAGIGNKTIENSDVSVFSNNQQAAIFKNENGMVTIRSPRLQSAYEDGPSISNYFSELKPMFGPEISNPYVPMCHTNFSDASKKTSFDAQEILSGLPGIEITKVDNSISNNDLEDKKISHEAEVSIIPTSNGAYGSDTFNFIRDDWPFESVFTPRDVLEDDLDADERELEAFKRFCQQSVPLERKEKVAHLNVKDIFINKKRNVSYS